MVQVILGEKGTGKTKRILDLANSTVKTAKGSVIFIDDDNRYMFDLNHSIRFINATVYGVESPKRLYGFLCGLAASDFDLEYVFIDRFLSIIKHDLDSLEEFFSQLDSYTKQSKITVILSVSGSAADLPPFMKGMVIV